MLQRRVVLILGAGASKPYGFPTGRELITQILATDPSALYELPGLSPVHTRGAVSNFLDSLRKSGTTWSIDEFLRRRPDYRKIGKAMIAYHLMPIEHESNLYGAKPEEHWYAYLFDQLIAPNSVEDFTRNPLAVITFNYDRSFETYLSNALQHSFQLDETRALSALTSIPIVHVHGALGPTNRAYNGRLDGIGGIVEQFNLLADADDQAESLPTCRRLIGEAEAIVVLGFGWHRQNVFRLNLAHVQRNVPIVGTTFGFTDSEVGLLISPQMGNARFLAVDKPNLGCLRDHLGSFLTAAS